MQLRLSVPTTPCYIEYAMEPDADFIRRFTAHKQRLWGEVTASIDNYIGQKVQEHIAASSSRKRMLRAKRAGVYAEALQQRIDAEVNRGLAIIALSPQVVTYSGPYSIVNKQIFEGAIGELLKDFGNFEGSELRRRRIQSRHWVDACAFELSQSFFGGRIS